MIDAFARAALYFHTLRHLKVVQLWSRVLFWLKKAGADLRVAPPKRMEPDSWEVPARRRPSMLGPRVFRFLNEDGAVSGGSDWDSPARSKLWLYNLHYFDDLNAAGAAERGNWHVDLVHRWVADNVSCNGVGWEPYPTSIRIVNWIKWAWAGNVLNPTVRQSLAVQTRWLRQRLETHLLGNHLFANAKALLFAGCYFEGPEADSWVNRGMKILLEQIPEQILPDGGHFERSTMYHALALEDMLDLVNLVRSRPALFKPWASSVSSWPETARRMGGWLAAMCHPDGQISFFNDAAFGIAPKPSELADYARRLDVHWKHEYGDGVVWFEHSGYVRAQLGDAVLFADVAPIGPDYLPGHAHADTLSFELSVLGQRVIVNSGTSSYEAGEDRQRERGTAAHNTVEVDGQDSSEVWAGFRVARRARPFDVRVRVQDDYFRISGSHDGYRRFFRNVIHSRTWEFRDGALEIVDLLKGPIVDGIAWIHFHPNVIVEHNGMRGTGHWNGKAIRWRTEKCNPRVVPSTWHPEFGKSLASTALALRLSGKPQACKFSLTWEGDR